MRIYTRRRGPDVRTGLLTLLLSCFDAEPGEVLLISPWLRDVELPTAGAGHFASIFGGHREQVRLSDLLARVAARHRLTLVVKPPAELVPIPDVRRLAHVLRARRELLTEQGLADYEATERAVEALQAQANAMAETVTLHAETLRMGWKLAERGADLRFLDHLHAKLLWTSAGALLGSANFTNGGFARNEELMAEVTTPREHAQLGEAARDFAQHATPARLYDLRPVLRSAQVRPDEFRGWSAGAADPMPVPVQELLRGLLAFLA